MHLHHAYGNNAYPVIPAEQVLPADESARFDMGITHIFKVNGNKLHRTDTGLCKLLFNQLQHDRLSAAADTGHNLDQLRSTSVRVEQRSTGPLAPLESKATVSQNIFYRKAFKSGIDFTKRQFSKNLSVKN